MKKLLFFYFLFSIFYFCPHIVLANYVLPYPSYMPGNIFYKVSRVADRIKSYWSWGNIAQIKYHLALSDKYLVEAKTLMDYRQYLLGVDALRRSDEEFSALPVIVQKATKEYGSVPAFQKQIQDAALEHKDILTGLAATVPARFTWTPEKSASIRLELGEEITHALDIRQQVSAAVSP